MKKRSKVIVAILMLTLALIVFAAPALANARLTYISFLDNVFITTESTSTAYLTGSVKTYEPCDIQLQLFLQVYNGKKFVTVDSWEENVSGARASITVDDVPVDTSKLYQAITRVRVVSQETGVADFAEKTNPGTTIYSLDTNPLTGEILIPDAARARPQP